MIDGYDRICRNVKRQTDPYGKTRDEEVNKRIKQKSP